MNTAASSKKRKAINEFFEPVAKSSATRPSRQTSSSLSPVTTAVKELQVPGLEIHHDFITAAEETLILGFLEDTSNCTWRTDLSRRTMHFGGTYCLMQPKSIVPSSPQVSKPEIIRAPSMPENLSWLIQRFVDSGIFRDDQRPQYCIVNEYTGKQGISAHTENFHFAEPVVGLSLLSSCPIRFQELTRPFDGSVRSGKAGEAEKTGRRVDVQMPDRSLLVMRGPSRWKWQHEILRSRKGRGDGWKRVSLTFRYKEEITLNRIESGNKQLPHDTP